MQAESFHDHFSAVAADYARHRPRYPEGLFRWLADLAPARTRAWDCATGNGQAAAALAGHFEQVLATDASREQLACAPAHPRVRYFQALAESSGLETGSVDLVTVGQALHWFRMDDFFREASRVLVPGGVLAVWTYRLAEITPAVDALVRELHGEMLARWWPPERAWVDTAYRDIRFPYSRVPAPELSMQAEWRLEDLFGYLRTWSAVQRCKEATGADPIEPLRAPLKAAWGLSGGERRPVRWPLTVMAGHTPSDTAP